MSYYPLKCLSTLHLNFETGLERGKILQTFTFSGNFPFEVCVCVCGCERMTVNSEVKLLSVYFLFQYTSSVSTLHNCMIRKTPTMSVSGCSHGKDIALLQKQQIINRTVFHADCKTSQLILMHIFVNINHCFM